MPELLIGDEIRTSADSIDNTAFTEVSQIFIEYFLYSWFIMIIFPISLVFYNNISKQAGAELGQAQLKLGLDFNTINLN